MDKIILCRRDSSAIGEPHDYCCKPISTSSALNWCDDCLARLPFWPADEHWTEPVVERR